MTKELLSQPNVITRILALSRGARGCRSWALQPLVQMLVPCQGPGTACRSLDFAGESVSTQNVGRGVNRSQDPQGFNPSGWSLCYKPRRTHSKIEFGACLRKLGISCPGQHIWHRLFMQNTWLTLLCRNKFCSHTSARLTELQAPPQHLQLPKLQTNAFWHPKYIYSPLQSSSRAVLSLKPPSKSQADLTNRENNLFSWNPIIFSNFSASISCQSMKSDATNPSSLSRNSCQGGISLMLLPLLPTCVVRHVALTAEIMDRDISQCSRYQLLQTDWFSWEALLENHPYLDGTILGSLENHPGQIELHFFLQQAGSRACCASGVPQCYLWSPAASLPSCPPRLSTPVIVIYYY